jgi:hypothetical protein
MPHNRVVAAVRVPVAAQSSHGAGPDPAHLHIAGVSAFLAWAVTALFLALMPSYVTQVAGTSNLALTGGIVTLMLGCAASAQTPLRRLPTLEAQTIGLSPLVIGLAGIIAAAQTGLLAVVFIADRPDRGSARPCLRRLAGRGQHHRARPPPRRSGADLRRRHHRRLPDRFAHQLDSRLHLRHRPGRRLPLAHRSWSGSPLRSA